MAYTVRQSRMLAGITQNAIAEKLGIHPQTYSKMEKQPDHMTIAQAQRFAQIVGVPLDQIFFGTNLLKVDNQDEPVA